MWDAAFSKTKPKSKKLVLSPGESTTVYIYYKNTGDVTWSNAGEHAVKLGTVEPQDGVNALIGTNRIAMSTAEVRGKKKATFTVKITAPKAPGTYTLKFKPLAEGKLWFGQIGSLTVTVK
jgi:hypothetical protein